MDNEKENNELDVPIIDNSYSSDLVDQVYDFPCPYVVKVIGEEDGSLEGQVREVFYKHVTEPDQVVYDLRSSKTGKYVTVAATFQAQSRQQLEALYSDLKQLKQVKFML